MKILVVEDEENISKLICDTLALGGFEVDVAFDGEKAIERVLNNEYALILLDIMLPKLDGFEVLKQIKNKEIPVIFLSAKNDVSSIVKGLQDGGQDYITKPFEPLELLARVELRIKKADRENVCKYKNIVVNCNERMVYKDEKQVFLTPKEYDLLVLLLKNIGISLSRDLILNKIWDIDADIETRTVDYHIGQLRTKLDLKNEIKTINKVGYRIEKE